MSTVTGAPDRYIQGRGEMNRLYEHGSRLGNSFLVVAEELTMATMHSRVEQAFDGTGAVLIYEEFSGTCSGPEIDRLATVADLSSCDAVLSVGGGRATNAARAVAALHGLPLMVVPTTAATGAPCSSVAIVTDEDGVFQELRLYPVHPALVVVDSDVIAQASLRTLVAGIGNTVAAWLGARAHQRSGADNLLGGKGALASYALATLGYETVLRDGLRAVVASQGGVATRAFEEVLEASIYCSGMAFENCGPAAAHSVGNALTLLPEARQHSYGELAAFGSIVQLVLENAPREEMDDVMNLFLSTGLPLTLEDLGLGDAPRSALEDVAEDACGPRNSMSAMPFEVSPADVLAALLAADATGHLYEEDEEHEEHEGEEDD
ncbi:MAG TPA: glycerol dehydrogenase [Candidatus Cryosericum sp.]|nr:glycerol dehydrogenase [Candidatus Cryosericum sp.]